MDQGFQSLGFQHKYFHRRNGGELFLVLGMVNQTPVALWHDCAYAFLRVGLSGVLLDLLDYYRVKEFSLRNHPSLSLFTPGKPRK